METSKKRKNLLWLNFSKILQEYLYNYNIDNVYDKESIVILK